MGKPSYSRRQLVATGVLFGTTTLAGCLGSGESDHGYTPGREPSSGASEIESIDELEAPTAGSSLSGTVGGGEPNWIAAHNMGFNGWYDANSYYPRRSYDSKEVTLSLVNVSGYIIEVDAYDHLRNRIYHERLSTPFTGWFSNRHATSANIRVLGSATGEAVEIDLTDNHHHEIWCDGAVLNATYWVGTW